MTWFLQKKIQNTYFAEDLLMTSFEPHMNLFFS